MACCWNYYREELLASLNIIAYVLGGSESFYPVSADTPSDPNSRAAVWTPFLPSTGVKGEITMPDGSNVRDCVCKTMSNLQEMMLSNSEDDTKSLSAIVKVSF